MNAQAGSKIVIQVLVPHDVPAAERQDFEAAAVEFLFGVDHPRPELHQELTRRGIDVNALAAAARMPVLGVCPVPDAFQFIPSLALAKHATAAGASFTAGGSVEVEFAYDQARNMTYPQDVLYVNLRVPPQVTAGMTDELTGHLATALFGECQLPQAAHAYLAAHGTDLREVAHAVGGGFRSGSIPPTTRVSPVAAAQLKKAGLNTDQFGKIEVRNVSPLT